MTILIIKVQNISGVANLNTNERDGWGETSKTVQSQGCIATKPPCNCSPASFINSSLVLL